MGHIVVTLVYRFANPPVSAEACANFGSRNRKEWEPSGFRSLDFGTAGTALSLHPINPATVVIQGRMVLPCGRGIVAHFEVGRRSWKFLNLKLS